MTRLLRKTWRIVATGLSFVAFGLFALIIALVLTIILYPLPLSPLRKRTFTRAIIRSGMWIYVRSLRALGLLTFEFQNFEDLDVTGTLVVANHPSLLDAVFLIACFPNACCIVKAKMANNPFTSRLISLAGYIPNSDQGTQVVEKAADALKRGEVLILFPEGTRTDDFDTLHFQRGCAYIALASGCPILPVAIECTPPALRKHEPWYHVPEKRPHFRFTAQALMSVSESIDRDRPSGVQARQLTRCLQSHIAMQIQPGNPN